MAQRVRIVGGVAGGASCAARLRRLSEDAEIVVFDRGPYVSFANCGLPYHVGDVIPDERQLLVASPELFRDRFAIEVRIESEVLSVDVQKREIEVEDRREGRRYREPYDALVLAPGGAPIRPPLPGIDAPGIFSLRTIPDSRRIRAWLAEHQATQAVVVGGGFIGLEMAENLAHRGLAVTLVEQLPQPLPPLDPEMAVPVAGHLRARGVDLRLGDAVAAFELTSSGRLRVRTASGAELSADVVILGLGVKPETTLARGAGLALGPSGGIRVDERMQTSDPHVWAVGDAVEVVHVVSGTPHILPLAGPANRQGRLAADAIAGREPRFRGVQSTSVCGAFGLVIAQTGASERGLRAAGAEGFESIYLHPGHHVGYFPGARPIHLKLIFQKPGGRLLGAQAVGEEGVERRIDVLATAIQLGATVFDLEEAELCYAPQFGAAKDPVNMAGMIAANHLRGDLPLADWRSVGETDALLVDVREPAEFAAGHLEHAVNLPLSELRRRSDELPRDRELWVYCQAGQRSYYALRALRQWGYDVRNLPGGYETWNAFRELGPSAGSSR
jgi:NADPH-dependent 2,4-dienoyl-CoA reductase/sulfur reductase-like enzyme/rhodanese-related sulfurtransferase